MMNDPREYNVSLPREQRYILLSALLDWHSLTLLICAALLALMAVYRHSTPHLYLSIACLLIWPLVIFYVMRNDDFSVRVVRPRLYVRFSKITLRDRQVLHRLIKLRDGYLQATEALIRRRRHMSIANWQSEIAYIDQLINRACELIIRLDTCRHRFISMPDDHRLTFEIERNELILQTTQDRMERKRIELALEEMKRRKSFLHDYSLGVEMAETQLDRVSTAMTAISMGDVTHLDHEALRNAYEYLEAVCYGDYAMNRSVVTAPAL